MVDDDEDDDDDDDDEKVIPKTASGGRGQKSPIWITVAN